MNLYNNGFAAGILAIVLFPTITAIAKHRKPVLQDYDYFDVFQSADPVDVRARERRLSHEPEDGAAAAPAEPAEAEALEEAP
jgi:hypothetical protein